MNIYLYNSRGEYSLRPDTTLNRESGDFYMPDGVEQVSCSSIIYIRVNRAAKAVSEKFAQRYYSQYGVGVVLSDSTCNSSIYESILIDGSTIVSSEQCPVDELDAVLVERLNRAIAYISRRSSLRVGDYVALELANSGELRLGSLLELDICGKRLSVYMK